MFDKRDREHPLGLMCEVAPLWTIGLLANAWNVSLETAWKMMRGYLRRNLVNVLKLGCKLIDPPERETYRHMPGMEIHPDLPTELAATFAARYRRANSCEVLGFSAGRKALNIFGMNAAKSASPLHATHDLLLAACFLANRHRGCWEFEPEPPGGRRNNEPQPDSGIFRPGSRVPEVFIECCGSYRQSRIQSLFEFSNGSGVPLELW